MPTYPVINKKTGEKQELSMTMKEYDQWRSENPDWDKDWMAGVGGVTYGSPKQSEGFKEVMTKVQKAHPGANLSRYT
jgi:cobalamin biosynthesis protein CobD/CbiB